MQKLIRFFKNVVLSFSSAEFYGKVLATPFSFSVKYFLFLIFIAGIVYSVVYNATISPILNKITDNGQEIVDKLIPNDFKLNINNDTVEYFGEKPFILSVNDLYKNLKLTNKARSLKKNVFVIDTKTSFSIEKFKEYNTFFWITKNGIVSSDPDRPESGVKTAGFKKSSEEPITKKDLKEIVRFAIPFQKQILKFLTFLILPIAITYLLLNNLFMLFWVALIAFIIGKFAKYNYCFNKYFQLSIHASTIPFLIEIGLNISLLFNFIPARIPFWYPLLTLIILFFFLRKIEVKKVRI